LYHPYTPHTMCNLYPFNNLFYLKNNLRKETAADGSATVPFQDASFNFFSATPWAVSSIVSAKMA